MFSLLPEKMSKEIDNAINLEEKIRQKVINKSKFKDKANINLSYFANYPVAGTFQCKEDIINNTDPFYNHGV